MACLVPILNATRELSYPNFLNNGQQILLFEAIKNMEQGGAFSDHRIQITKIGLVKNQPVHQKLAVMGRKYQLPNSGSTAKALFDPIKQNSQGSWDYLIFEDSIISFLFQSNYLHCGLKP